MQGPKGIIELFLTITNIIPIKQDKIKLKKFKIKPKYNPTMKNNLISPPPNDSFFSILSIIKLNPNNIPPITKPPSRLSTNSPYPNKKNINHHTIPKIIKPSGIS